MNKYTRRAELYWNCHHIEPPSQMNMWDWPTSGTPIYATDTAGNMDCCDEIQSKIDSLQEELEKCKRTKNDPIRRYSESPTDLDVYCVGVDLEDEEDIRVFIGRPDDCTSFVTIKDIERIGDKLNATFDSINGEPHKPIESCRYALTFTRRKCC